MKSKYIKPELDIYSFHSEDIITTSGEIETEEDLDTDDGFDILTEDDIGK